jgi:WD40 repeat protein
MYRSDPTARVLKASGSFPHSPSTSQFAFRGDGTVVWHTETSVEEWSAEGAHISHTGLSAVLALDDDGLRTVSRGADGHLTVYSLIPFQAIAALDPGNQMIDTASFEPGGDLLAGGSEGGWLQVWQISSGRRRFEIRAHADRITCIRFTSDGAFIGTAGRDSRIRLWDAASGKLRATLAKAAFAWVFDLNANASWIVYSAREGRGWESDSRVRLHEAATGKLLHSYPAPAEVTAIAFNPTLFGWQYAFVSGDGQLQICQEGADCTVLRHETRERLNSVAFNPDGTLVYTGAESGEVRAWDVQTRGDTLVSLGSRVTALAPFASGEFLIASNDSRTGFFSFLSERGAALRRRVWQIDGAEIDALATNRDGSRIASASDDRLIRLWTNDGHLLLTLNGHAGRVTSLAFSPDGRVLASASADATVRLVGVESGRQTAVLPHADPVRAVRFNPGGALLATTAGSAVRLWDAHRYQLVRAFPCPASAAVLFSPDGRRVLAGGGDGAIRVWDVRSGKEIGRMTGHQSAVLSLAFSPDGSRLASGSTDETVRIWDANSYEPLLVLTGQTGAVHSLFFSSDGGRLISAGTGPIRLWETSR